MWLSLSSIPAHSLSDRAIIPVGIINGMEIVPVGLYVKPGRDNTYNTFVKTYINPVGTIFHREIFIHATGLHFQKSPARGSLRKNSPPRPDPAGNPRGRGTSGIPDIPYEIINSSYRSTSTLGITSLNFCSSVMSCINNGWKRNLKWTAIFCSKRKFECY